jgi:hypothetical protein
MLHGVTFCCVFFFFASSLHHLYSAEKNLGAHGHFWLHLYSDPNSCIRSLSSYECMYEMCLVVIYGIEYGGLKRGSGSFCVFVCDLRVDLVTGLNEQCSVHFD